jgi:hypothetical protein
MTKVEHIERWLLQKDYAQLAQCGQLYELEAKAIGSPLDPLILSCVMGALCFTGDLTGARFLGKRHPQLQQNNNDFLQWTLITKALQTVDYAQAHRLLSETRWSRELLTPVASDVSNKIRQSTLDVLSQVYENIEQDKAGMYLGLSGSQVVDYVKQNGWDLDSTSGN